MSLEEVKSTRLNKYLSEQGFCSRREADKLIEQGRVRVNGQLPELGTKVSKGDEIRVDGKVISSQVIPVYLAFNKPVGVTCTTDNKAVNNIVDFINYPSRIFHIGRLDKPSEGLIFLTNDGDIVNKILRAGNNHEKEYLVEVDRPISDDFILRMSNGVKIMDTITQKCKVYKESKFTFRIILTQGLNRQIRRMCSVLDYEVVKLKRIRIMNIKLDGIRIGEWRYFTENEIREINDLIKDSISTQETSMFSEEE